MDTTISLQQAEKYCLDIAANHYENFPVVSLLIPKPLRIPVAVIYTFARTADNFADEGIASQSERLRNLQEYADKLDLTVAASPPNNPIFIALQKTIFQYQLPTQLFHDLLTAFTQDVSKTRYQNFTEVLHYCKFSANPIGRILLHLYGENTEDKMLLSDKICSALQIVNFLQDVHEDLDRGRIYLPQDELNESSVSIEQIRNKQISLQWLKLMDRQIDRVRSMMLEGSLLTQTLHGRLRLNLKMTVGGGLKILEKLEQDITRGLEHKLILSKKDWLGILIKGLL